MGTTGPTTQHCGWHNCCWCRYTTTRCYWSLRTHPKTDLGDMTEVIDMDAVVSLGAASTFTAVTAARWTVRMKPRYLRKAHGVFMVGAALFMMWRQGEIKAVQAKKEVIPPALLWPLPPQLKLYL